LIGHTDLVTCVEVGAECVYTGSCDCTVCVWDIITGQVCVALMMRCDV
jgi:WD40 repeat protein